MGVMSRRRWKVEWGGEEWRTRQFTKINGSVLGLLEFLCSVFGRVFFGLFLSKNIVFIF